MTTEVAIGPAYGPLYGTERTEGLLATASWIGHRDIFEARQMSSLCLIAFIHHHTQYNTQMKLALQGEV